MSDPAFTIEMADALSDDIAELVERGQEAYERSKGVACNYRSFHFIARNASGQVIGVLTGYTAYGEVYVDDLWVDAGHRSQGIGRRLLGDLEQHFSGDGYNNINLVTNAFQAVNFYQKCGFDIEFVRENRKHSKLTKTFMIKYFNEDDQNQGILD